MKQDTRNTRDKKNIVGILLTLVISGGFIWAMVYLAGLSGEKKPLSAEEMRMNELRAYRHLKTIARAQRDYIRQDWDGDGRKVYAMFYVHLWRSVSLDGEPIEVGLIPRELGFAMEATTTLRGYYYMDLRRRGENGREVELDYGKEWGVAALPGARGRTGLLVFIVDQDRVIYAAARVHSQPHYPHEPGANGWTRIDGEADLKALQETVNYPVNKS